MPWADQEHFQQLYRSNGPHDATAWFYNESKKLGHIHRDGTSSGIHWQHSSDWGPILISINEAKPEKDPRDIAAAAKELPAQDAKKTGNNPATQDCVFCWDSTNESNHLRVHLDLHGEPFSLHYSPYAYFPEHCIVATQEHRPMVIDAQTIDDLLELATRFPDYFFGSNADLPIVGGSILNHHHYQGGRFAFPLEEAPTLIDLMLPGCVETSAQILKWPLSCIRLTGANRDEILHTASVILDWWKQYSDPDANIIAISDDGTRHNTITPIARKKGSLYELDLILRCNITSDEHPLGIFHPHQEVHRVKKENIGLIEAMGLAILPPRVKDEFDISEGFEDNDREQVAALFTQGLVQCGVLATDEARAKALDSLEHFLAEDPRK